MNVGVISCTGGGGSIVNNGTGVIICNDTGIPNGVVQNSSTGKIFINADTIGVNLVTPSTGPIFYSCLNRTGGTDGANAQGLSTNSASQNWQVGGLLSSSTLTVGTLSYAATDSAGGDVLTTDGAGNLTLQPVSLPLIGNFTYVSQISGNDSTGTGSYTQPYATFGKAVTVATGLGLGYIIGLDGALYDEQISILVDNIIIYAPFASLSSSVGDSLTLGGNGLTATFNFISSGAGNAVNLVSHSAVVTCVANFSGDFASTVSDGGILTINCNQILGNISNTGNGRILVNTDQKPAGTISAGVFGQWVDGIISTLVDINAGNATFTISSPAITFTGLATAGKVNIIVPSTASAQFVLTDIQLNGVGGTNFSGIAGDRDLVITDGTSVYTTIPATTLQGLINNRWGSVDVPFSVTVPINQSTAAGANIYAQYANGTTDYTAGSVTVDLVYTQIAS